MSIPNADANPGSAILDVPADSPSSTTSKHSKGTPKKTDPNGSGKKKSSQTANGGHVAGSDFSVSTSKVSHASRTARRKLLEAQLELNQMTEEQKVKAKLRELQLREEKERHESTLKILEARRKVKYAEMEVELVEEGNWSADGSGIVSGGIQIASQSEKIERYFQSCHDLNPPVTSVDGPMSAPRVNMQATVSEGRFEPENQSLAEQEIEDSVPVLNPHAPEWRPLDHNTDHPAHRPEPNKVPQQYQPYDDRDNVLLNIVRQQNQTTQALIANLNMPKRELLLFDGNPVSYPVFIRNFEVNIEQMVSDNNARLAYLIQHCTGPAKDAIKNCVILPPEDGYAEARSILHHNFGQKHIIVHAAIDNVVKGPQIKASETGKLLQLARNMRNCHLCSRQMKYTADINSMDTLEKIVRRFPTFLQAEWAKEAGKLIYRGVEPEFLHLTEFLETRAAIANTRFGKLVGSKPDVDKDTKSRVKVPNQSTKATTMTTQVGNQEVSGEPNERAKYRSNKDAKCHFCQGQHKLHRCRKFAGKSYDGKETLYENRVSSPSRQTNQASSGSSSTSTTTASTTNGASVTANCKAIKTNQPRISLQVVPVKVSGLDGGPAIQTYAFLDSGSDTTICLESLTEKLGLRGKPINYTLSTLDAESTKHGREVQLDLRALNGVECVHLNRVWTTDMLPISASSIPTVKDIKGWRHLNGIELPELDEKEVTILIGNDVPEAHWALEEKRGGRKQPYAIRTLLGWTVIGPMKGKKDSDATINFINMDQVSNCESPIKCLEPISSQLHRMYNADFTESLVETKYCMSLEDRRAKANMDRSVCLQNGHYQLNLPWRYDTPSLPCNKHIAEKRLNVLRRRLLKDPALHEKYSATIDDYIKQGHARQVSGETHEKNDTLLWYLPHHPVVHPNKPDKVRVVFDCAAKCGGTSLNDQLLQGPDLTNSLVGVLLRFRQYPIALVADIKQMFHQVHVTPKDSNALRFLWWPKGDLSKKPVDHQMRVHLFGATSSPSCSAYALQKTAYDNRSDFDSDVVDSVYRNFYVDDYLKSVLTTEIAKRFITQVSALLSRGGFHLTKWISNCKEVLSSIPSEERAPSVMDLDLEDLPIDRALGVQWDVNEDTLHFRIGNETKKETRRGILSVVASVYDPLGLIAPFVLPAKRILQELTRLECDWDEEIPMKYLYAWHEWCQKLPLLKTMVISRCYTPSGFGKLQAVELHHFADASLEGYGVASYLRFIDDDGKIHCSLVIGKSRVAPLKTMTVPRLELTAATVAVNVGKQIREEIQLPIHCENFWTDSTIVLQYIHNSTRRFKTFVANRLQVIHDATSPDQWHHVPSQLNPADCASRGIEFDTTEQKSKLWFNGPEFLWKLKENWPNQPDDLPAISVDDKELKTAKVYTAVKGAKTTCDDVVNLLIQRFSSWYTLCKSVAWILRFKKYLRAHYGKCKGDLVPTGPITVREISEATVEIVKVVQQTAFPKELATKSKSQSTRPDSEGYTSPLRKLSPICINSVLCVGGRLNYAPISKKARHPIILPHNHYVTSLIIKFYHEIEGHVGVNHVLASIRRRFWILRGPATVRRVIQRCMTCRIWNAKPETQVMSPLPHARVTPGKPPFSSVGVDFFGPLKVKWRRGTAKRYGCIFTCLAIRAVHIEVTHTLSTDSFIQAVWRFVSRRGPPNTVYSDNGTNFRGAEVEVKEALASWNQEKITDSLRKRDIQWYFNPPAASHAGGVWERMIRSVRKILRSLVGNRLIDDETLLTLMAEVEKIINDRPLTHQSNDPNDLEPLTPNSLLLLRPNPCTSPGDLVARYTANDRRRHAGQMANLFWKRWIREYLPSLQQRQKWLKPKRNLAVGDLVIIIDENAPRGQ
ncbi:uncharacterized protein [Ptychodera flava]|uniref:uncharacterized protein n=1 Tax=Ptychodera flava TaxID=63121 RepID=UPI00396AA095